jgi:hypothetical protein
MKCIVSDFIMMISWEKKMKLLGNVSLKRKKQVKRNTNIFSAYKTVISCIPDDGLISQQHIRVPFNLFFSFFVKRYLVASLILSVIKYVLPRTLTIIFKSNWWLVFSRFTYSPFLGLFHIDLILICVGVLWCFHCQLYSQ